MYLLEPNRTEFDLSWRMFGVKVRVHPMFWLLTGVLGWNYLKVGFEYFFLFIGCAFISILIHELGHVFMGRLFGRDSHIVLYSFGGLAIGNFQLPHRWQRIAVSFAGPLAGFILLGAAWLFLRYGLPAVDPDGRMPMLGFAVRVLIVINLVWNLLNLAPIWPLDGGQISREIFTWLAPRNGLRLSLGFSFLLAALFALQALSAYYGGPQIPFLGWLSGPYTAILFGLLALQSFQLLQQAERNPWREDWPDRDDWR